MLSAQLQFWIFCHVIIPIKVLNHFRKVFRKATTLSVSEVFFLPTSFHSYISLSVKIIADESTFFLCMLGLHPTPTKTFEMSNSQIITFIVMIHHYKGVKPFPKGVSEGNDALFWKFPLTQRCSGPANSWTGPDRH